MSECDDEARFEQARDEAYKHALAFITEFWGERCPDFSEGCPLCEKFKQLDKLFENPFDDAEEDGAQ